PTVSPILMPQSIQALNGSCVLIPCTFQIPSAKNKHLINPAGIWWTKKRGSSDKRQLEKKDNWNIIGKLSEKNCTTVLNRISKTWTGDYSFSIEGNNHTKNKLKEKVKINVEDSPPSPQVTINKDMVREGDSVTLTCSAPAPCPSLPPTLSWTPRLSDSVTVFQENDDHTKHASSVMNFTASHLLHKQEVKCTAVYRLQTVNSERTSHTNVTLKVQYSPKNILVLIGKDGSLTCISDANPAVNNYTWYKVSGGEIKVVSYTQSLTSNITEVSGQYYCQAQNEHGLQNSSTVQLHCDRNLTGTYFLFLFILIKYTYQTSESGNETPVVHHDRGSEWGTGTTQGSSQSTLYGNINRSVGVMSEVQEEQEQCTIRGMTGKRKKTRQPESRDVSGRGFRSQDSTDSQKRKYESGTEQETMEDKKISTLDDQLKTPEPKEEATYNNICHQLCTKGPDKRSATVEASPEGPQDHHGIAFYPLISDETGTNESEYAVVRKVRSF
uniref:Myelin-associated glycoprotein-like n=1 Tax=Paramormyrops kingsleyae TaxID=1676925 RepID=A0A3B3RQH7_9TELE